MQGDNSSFSRLIGEVERKRLDPISVVILTHWSLNPQFFTDNSTTVIESFVSEIRSMNIPSEAKLHAYNLLRLRDLGGLADFLQRCKQASGQVDRPTEPTDSGSGQPLYGRERSGELNQLKGMQAGANPSYVPLVSQMQHGQGLQFNSNPQAQTELLSRPGFPPPNQSGGQIAISSMNIVRTGVNQPGQNGSLPAQLSQPDSEPSLPKPPHSSIPYQPINPGQHQVHNPSQHQVYNPGQHQVPNPSKPPQLYNPGQPQGPYPGQPQVYNPVQPQVPNPVHPQVPNPGHPQAPNPGQHQVPNPGQHQVPNPSKPPQLYNPGHPQAPNPGQPQGPYPGQPQVYNPGHPQVPNPVHSQAPNPSQHQVYNPGHPHGPNPGHPQAPNPSQHQVYNPGHPQGPNPGHPQGPNPLLSSNPQSQLYPNYAATASNIRSFPNPPSANMGQLEINPQIQPVPGMQHPQPPRHQIPDYSRNPPIPINQPQYRDQQAKCGICNKEIKTSSIQLQNCGHKVHLECLKNNYEMVKNDKCPIANCDKDLSSVEMGVLQPKSAYNQPQYPPHNQPQYPPHNQPQYPPHNQPQYLPHNQPQYPPQPPASPQGNLSEEQEVMNMLAMDPSFMKCPAERCLYVIYNENKSLVLDCPRCNKSYCLKCKKIAHPGQTCNESRGNNPPQFQQYNPGTYNQAGISYSQPPKRLGNACLCCGDDVNMTAPSVTLRCGDVFHRECISRYAKGLLSSNSPTNCICGHPINQQELQEVFR